MATGISFIFIFLGVMIVTAIIFGVWIIVTFLKLIARGIASIFRIGDPPRAHQVSAGEYMCPRRGCRAINPSSAHFCRRCGQELLKGPYSRQVVW